MKIIAHITKKNSVAISAGHFGLPSYSDKERFIEFPRPPVS